MRNKTRLLRITHGNFTGVNLTAVKNTDGTVTVKSNRDAATTIVIPTIVPPTKPKNKDEES